MTTDILTESGTNEVEFLEFYLSGQSFAINVAKIMQIITLEEDMVTATAGAPPSVMGSLLWRDHTIDLIDLSSALNKKERAESERPVVLITNFNNISCGFRVDGVNRIYRVSWDNIQPMDNILDQYSPRFTGTITINDKNILLVDFEKIVADLFSTDMEHQPADILTKEDQQKLRTEKNIVFAEDSVLIRTNLVKFLQKAGYNLMAFENGQVAYDYFNQLKQNAETDITDQVNLVVTDIEMPQMDGLTLCRRIKEDQRTSDIPVIVFSSLINEQMIVKCREVGADDYLSKPRAEDLVRKIDDMLLA